MQEKTLFKNGVEEFDTIFSLGDACSCTETLRLAELQKVSYPFDWLLDGDFSTRAEILLSDFKGWFNKEDLELQDEYRNTLVYQNKKTKITHIHDFYKDKHSDFDTGYIDVSAKFQRRSTRLLESLDKSKTALLVYITTPNKEIVSNTTLKVYQEKFSEKYPTTVFNMLYFYSTAGVAEKDKKVIQVSDTVTKVLFDFSAYSEKFKWEINRESLLPSLSSLKLRTV